MRFGNVWLLACVCLVLGGCAVAAMPPPQALILSGPTLTPPTTATNNAASRLGPPSQRGLGRRRVDHAFSAMLPFARE